MTFFACLPGSNSAQAEDAIPDALTRYVQRPEPAFAWQLAATREVGKSKLYQVQLTSQVWQKITWRHDLLVFEPDTLNHPKHVLLFVTGGSNGRQPGASDLAMGARLAQLCSSRVAVLRQVPNQPMLDGRREDDLITETWLRYLKSGDESWPLLFPMVKSAVKAMDAIEQLAMKHFKMPIEGFVITGASKRGWTSWLTPAADTRIVGTAPIVIDVLNFRPQMKHQLETWGKYSDQIRDYSSKGLIVEGKESPRERQLRLMMDPYTYRERVKIPKLLINGANDPYWVVDAMKFYWDDLSGPRYALHIPNAGHGLDGGTELALSSVAAFYQHTVSGKPLPALHWSRSKKANTVTLTVSSDVPPKGARLWQATSDTKDFRRSNWKSQPLSKSGDKFEGKIPLPSSGHVAHFAELQFVFAGVPYSLTTLVQRD